MGGINNWKLAVIGEESSESLEFNLNPQLHHHGGILFNYLPDLVNRNLGLEIKHMKGDSHFWRIHLKGSNRQDIWYEVNSNTSLVEPMAINFRYDSNKNIFVTA